MTGLVISFILGKIKVYFLKYWKIILPALAVLIFVWWMRGVISDRDEALADLAAEKARTKQLEQSIGKQNQAIVGLASSYKELTAGLLEVEETDGRERNKLNKIVRQVDQAVDALINAPAVAAELACETAEKELKDTKGAKDLLNPSAD